MVPPLRHSQAVLPAHRWAVGIGGFRKRVSGGNEERFWWDEDKGFRLALILVPQMSETRPSLTPLSFCSKAFNSDLLCSYHNFLRLNSPVVSIRSESL